MTRAGSLPCIIVLFQTDEGSNEPYGITLGILSSLNSSRTYRECVFHIIILHEEYYDGLYHGGNIPTNQIVP